MRRAWADDDHTFCHRNWCGGCDSAHLRTSRRQHPDLQEASAIINNVFNELRREHPEMRLISVPNGLLLVDNVEEVEYDDPRLGTARVTVQDDPDKIEALLELDAE